MAMIRRNTIFTNVALNARWRCLVGGDDRLPPENLIDWQGQNWTPDCGRKAAHPNARFTVASSNALRSTLNGKIRMVSPFPPFCLEAGAPTQCRS